jgi:hypothetical protein
LKKVKNFTTFLKIISYSAPEPLVICMALVPVFCHKPLLLVFYTNVDLKKPKRPLAKIGIMMVTTPPRFHAESR